MVSDSTYRNSDGAYIGYAWFKRQAKTAMESATQRANIFGLNLDQVIPKNITIIYCEISFRLYT